MSKEGMSIPEVERYSFTRPNSINDKETIIQEYDSTESLEITAAESRGNLEKLLQNPEHAEQFVKIMESQMRWAEEKLGISLKNRVPNSDKIFVEREPGKVFQRIGKLFDQAIQPYLQKFFEVKEDMGEELGRFMDLDVRATLHEQMPLLKGVEGFTSNKQEVVLRYNERVAQLYRVLSHEILHAMSYTELKQFNQVQGQQKDSYIPKRSGYQNLFTGESKKGKSRTLFTGLNEYVTDTLSLETLQYQKDKGGPDFISTTKIDYIAGVLFMDRIFQLIRERAPDRFEEYKKSLYQGYFTGETKNLAFLDELFGEGTLKFLSTFNPSVKVNKFFLNTAEFAAALKDRFKDTEDVYAQMIEDWKENKPITLTGGVVVQNPNTKFKVRQ